MNLIPTMVLIILSIAGGAFLYKLVKIAKRKSETEK